MERIVCYFTSSGINCGCIPADVILCVTQDDVANYVQAQLLLKEKQPSWNTIPCLFSYTFKYDDAQLPSYDPDTLAATDPLVTADITGVICSGCLTDYIESKQAPVSADADNCIQLRADGLYIPCANSALITSVLDTVSVDLDVTLGVLTANVEISADAANRLSLHADGLYAESCVVDSQSIDFDTDVNGCVTGDVKLSADVGNIITIQPDGIYATATPCVTPTDTIDFSIDGGGCVTGGVIVSAFPDNCLQALVSGLYVECPAQQTDGWIDARDTWSFNALGSIIGTFIMNVAVGALTKYRDGDKLKLFQDAQFKYFSVVGKTNSTLVIAAGDTYVLSVNPITLPQYSHSETPVGFPSYFTWSPTFTVSGAMTIGTISLKQNRFRVIGGYLEFDATNTFVLGGVASTTVGIGLPVALSNVPPGDGADSSAFCVFPANISNGGVTAPGSFRCTPTPQAIVFPHNGNWVLGAAGESLFGRCPIRQFT